jgi:hypothetical protein
MSIYIAAVDVRPGDIIAHVGTVGAVDIVGDEVIFTMRWSETVIHGLAIDAEVWIDREAIGGAA